MDQQKLRAAEAVLREVNAGNGTNYVLIREMVGGMQSRPWLIADEDMNQAVLKWSGDVAWASQIQRAAQAVERLRSKGYPTPAWTAVGTTSAGLGYQVQEVARGEAVGRLTVGVAHELIRVLEQQDGLDPDPERSWSDFVINSYRDRFAPSLVAVAAIDAGGQALVDRCVRLLAHFGQPVFPRVDLVHGDFRLGNILLVDGSVSGVVDIEALGSGTRVFDYATLLDHDLADDAAVTLLIDAAKQIAGPAVLAHCFVHVAIDLALFMNRRVPSIRRSFLDTRLSALADRVGLMPVR